MQGNSIDNCWNYIWWLQSVPDARKRWTFSWAPPLYQGRVFISFHPHIRLEVEIINSVLQSFWQVHVICSLGHGDSKPGLITKVTAFLLHLLTPVFYLSLTKISLFLWPNKGMSLVFSGWFLIVRKGAKPELTACMPWVSYSDCIQYASTTSSMQYY